MGSEMCIRDSDSNVLSQYDHVSVNLDRIGLVLIYLSRCPKQKRFLKKIRFLPMLDVLQQRACPPRASAKCVLILRAASGCVISSYDPMLLGNNTWYNEDNYQV